MKYILISQTMEDARRDAPPFIPDSMLFSNLYGLQVFGPYDTKKEASDRLRMFPPDWGNLEVVPLRSLSEELDNPYGALWAGDSPS